MNYTFTVKWNATDEEWVALCEEMPGVVTGSKDPGTAVRKALRLVRATQARLAAVGVEVSGAIGRDEE